MYSRIQKRLKQLGYLEASTDENMAGMLRGSINPRLLEEIT